VLYNEPLIFSSNAAIVNESFPLYAEVRLLKGFMIFESQAAERFPSFHGPGN